MSVDYGPFGSIVSGAGSLIAVGGALLLTWKKRSDWEPADEDLPLGAQRIAGLAICVVIAALWFSQHDQPSSSLLFAAWACLAAALLFAAAYGVLIGMFTFERQVATGPRSTVRRKIVGGFVLTGQAKRLLKNQRPQVTLQEIFKGAAYDPDHVWTRSSRSLAKLCFFLAYIGTVVFGTAALAAAAIAIAQPRQEQVLAEVSQRWIETAETAQKNGTVIAGAPLPTALAGARTSFEAAWRNAGLNDRTQLAPDVAYKALSFCVKVYRVQEENEAVKTNSVHWADEAIRHFEERQDKTRLLEALLGKAAVMLDAAQQENATKDVFENVSKTGDALMTRAAGLASPDKRAEVFRLSSRFYYNLSRPKSFRLSDNWDNNYLLLSHQRASKAYELDPKDIKNINQLLRATMKASKNPPQDGDPKWAAMLRQTQLSMKALWQQHDAATTSATSRRSALSVLGTGTLEAVAREWHELPAAARRAAAPKLAAELESDALPLLRETEALLQNGELKKAYGFDLAYDIARVHAQRAVMLALVDRARAANEFREVITNIGRARERASATQVDAAMKDVQRDLSFSKLSQVERGQLSDLLRAGVK
jgi:hypothetical protein